ncbi:MAG: hypothetical protein ABJM43_02720 [Paracoccaceae bacterium]
MSLRLNEMMLARDLAKSLGFAATSDALTAIIQARVSDADPTSPSDRVSVVTRDSEFVN